VIAAGVDTLRERRFVVALRARRDRKDSNDCEDRRKAFFIERYLAGQT